MPKVTTDPLGSSWSAVQDSSGVETDPIEQYKLDCRRIKRQENSDGIPRKRVPYATGTRYLVVNHGRAAYQSDDLLDVLEYFRDHPTVTVFDLDEEYTTSERRLIGQYMATSERERTFSPVFDPNVGKAGKFGVTSESLLKDRKPAEKIIESQDATPFEVKLLAAMETVINGKPFTLGKANRASQCPKCGLTVSCKCDLPLIRKKITPAEAGVAAPAAKPQSKPIDPVRGIDSGIFSAGALLNDKLAGHKIHRAELWIVESLGA